MYNINKNVKWSYVINDNDFRFNNTIQCISCTDFWQPIQNKIQFKYSIGEKKYISILRILETYIPILVQVHVYIYLY